MTPRVRRAVALVLCVVGVVLLAHSAVAYLRAEAFRREALHAPVLQISASPAQRPQPGDLIGLLDIPRLRMCAPIVEGDETAALARGIGHLSDTPLPWEPGNTAVAGHRDTVFRPLARIRLGDVIAIHAGGQRYEYTVSETRVVEPNDLSVLRDEPRPTLTLITCYPFRFIGPAPKRFIVRAERIASSADDQQDCRDRSRQSHPAR